MLSKTRFQELRRIAARKDPDHTDAFFVDGWRWLEEALALPEPPECVLVTNNAARTAEEATLLQRARSVAREFHEATSEQIARLTGSVTSPGVAALVRWRPVALDDVARAFTTSPNALVVALDAVSDPGNAGTIVRTADWFGASAVLFSAGSAEPTNAKVVRATMGSLFHLPIATADSLPAALKQLREREFVAVGATLDGESADTFAWPERIALIVGNEAIGIQPAVLKALDRRVRIERIGRAESLNAAVAAAILISQWRRAHPSPKTGAPLA